MLAPVPCTLWSAPEVGERKEIVRSASARTTSTASTTRRSTALRALPAACLLDLERWTDEPSTATRAVRFGGAIPHSLARPTAALGSLHGGNRFPPWTPFWFLPSRPGDSLLPPN